MLGSVGRRLGNKWRRWEGWTGKTENREGGRLAYENLGSFMFSFTDNTSLVSSSAMMSLKWYSRASLLVAR